MIRVLCWLLHCTHIYMVFMWFYMIFSAILAQLQGEQIFLFTRSSIRTYQYAKVLLWRCRWYSLPLALGLVEPAVARQEGPCQVLLV